jgi:hypothetical protein
MIYQWELSSGHQISVDNEGAQTVVTIVHSSPGQQQRTSNSFTTGIWILPPEMLVTPTGAILTITTPTGVSTLDVRGNSVQMYSNQSDGSQSASSSSSTSTASFERMQPMQPMTMQPMKPMQPMTMQMGDMKLNMGTSATNQQSFCTQCGNSVKPTDRFCAGCGHKLVS